MTSREITTRLPTDPAKFPKVWEALNVEAEKTKVRTSAVRAQMIHKLVQMTASEYAASVKEANTLYIVLGSPAHIYLGEVQIV